MWRADPPHCQTVDHDGQMKEREQHNGAIGRHVLEYGQMLTACGDIKGHCVEV
jgi:hypothetical protein